LILNSIKYIFGLTTPHRVTQQDAHRMIAWHARKAGIESGIGNHSLRATGFTDYLKTRGRWNMRKTWLRTPPRALPSCMIGGVTKPLWMSMRR
jgi:hypothetical protein